VFLPRDDGVLPIYPVAMRTILASLALPLALLAAGDPAPAPTRVGYAWPLPTCVVSGEPLGDKPVVKVLEDAKDPSVNGREVRFCCEKCVSTFEANRAKYLKQADEAIIARELPSYPAIHCVVMPDEKLPAAGTPDAKEAHQVVVGNQVVRVCCAQCERKVKRNPTAYLGKLQTAIAAAQVPTYPMKTCPISGRELPATPTDTLIAGRLVRFCCAGCQATAERDTAATLAKLDAAAKAK